MLRRVALTLLAIVGLGALAGCSKSTKTTAPVQSPAGFGAVTLHVTDAPAMFDAVNLDVQEVWVHRMNDGSEGDTLGDHDDGQHHGGDLNSMGHHDVAQMFHGRHEHDGDGSWIELADTVGVINLLDLQDGVFATLGVGAVPAGHYNQIRLKLGPNNTIVVDGVTSPLEVPSGERSGYKLIGRFEVTADVSSDIGIDFDAARSIHQEGNGDWVLRPRVRIAPLGTTGKIAGLIRPRLARSWIFAIQGADTVASTATHLGHYTLSLLPPGNYSVNVAPVGAFRDTSVSPISVAMNRTTDVAEIVLTPKAVVSPVMARPVGIAKR
jgi:hypothetical protein